MKSNHCAVILVASLWCLSLPTDAVRADTPNLSSNSPVPRQVALYRQLMHVNGLDDIVNSALAQKRAQTHDLILKKSGKAAFSEEEEARFSTIADGVLVQTRERLIDIISSLQSRTLSEDDLHNLIKAYSLPTTQIYLRAKAENSPEKIAKIQNFMVSTVVRIVNTLKDPSYVDTSAPPSSDPRVLQAEALYRVDGTTDLIRHTVDQTQMPLVLGQVQNYVDVASLTADEKYRMATIAVSAQTQLGDRIIGLSAENVSRVLTVADLKTLTAVMNIPAQRKVTQLRLNDDGSVDAAAGAALDSAESEIIRQYEAVSKP